VVFATKCHTKNSSQISHLCRLFFWQYSFSRHLRFMTTGEDRNKDRFKDWKLCGIWKLSFPVLYRFQTCALCHEVSHWELFANISSLPFILLKAFFQSSPGPRQGEVPPRGESKSAAPPTTTATICYSFLSPKVPPQGIAPLSPPLSGPWSSSNIHDRRRGSEQKTDLKTESFAFFESSRLVITEQ